MVRVSGPNVASLSSRAASVRLLRLAVVGLGAIPAALTSPLRVLDMTADHSAPSDDVEEPLTESATLIYFITAIALVLLGGVFAGLTIALMGQDEINLQVIAESGDERQKNQARRVLSLLRRGKHWVLVTLLLSNVITNETLPIVLDRSLGGGWQAVVSSTVLIVVFGEIVPQSICVRYGLPIGSLMAPSVLSLMWLMSPVAWPIAQLLDYILGKDHGTTYKKAGLKTLVTLHRTLGTDAAERLNSDEVTIISSVLDLKGKPVGNIMTPIKDVFILSADVVLDEKMINTILSEGFSRIPIHEPGNKNDFVGMLLVKTLIAYDPEDGLRVSDFTLATLPETRPETSCLDIVNFFQEGKSHMALVTDSPGESYGALGVVTLEDVIEELIGEEIIDESDVFVDVHKAIRRWAPGPLMRIPAHIESVEEGVETLTEVRSRSQTRSTTYYKRWNDPDQDGGGVRSASDMRDTLKQHFGHLGPSNKASDPRSTQIQSITIKAVTAPPREPSTSRSRSESTPASRLLAHSIHLPAEAGYGTLEPAEGGGRATGTLESVASRASSSSGLSSRTPKIIIPSERPPSIQGDLLVDGATALLEAVSGDVNGLQPTGQPMETTTVTVVGTSPSGSHVTTVVSGRIQQTTVDKKLVITPMPGEENEPGGPVEPAEPTEDEQAGLLESRRASTDGLAGDATKRKRQRRRRGRNTNKTTG